MSAQCENLATCGLFREYQGNSEVIKNGWIRMYCNDILTSEKCQRKQIKK